MENTNIIENEDIITDTPQKEDPTTASNNVESPTTKREEDDDVIDQLKKISNTNFFIKLQGLPSESTAEELAQFFSVDLPNSAFKFPDSDESRKNGEAFIIIDCEEKCRQILSFHNQEIRGNCVEIYPTSKNILIQGFERIRPSPGHVIHIKSTKPDTCSKDKIYKFLASHSAEIYSEEKESFILCKDIHGRNTGEAFVAVKTREMAEKIVEDKTNDRFTTKLKTLAQLKGAINLNRLRLISMERTRAPEPVRERPRRRRKRTPSPRRRPMARKKNPSRSRKEESPVRVYEDKKPSEHFVRVFGLPNSITERDVIRFFSPLEVISVRIERRVDAHKLPSALAFFRNHYAALAGMKKDNGFIGDHCLRLSLFSVGTPPPAQPRPNRWTQPVCTPRGFAPSPYEPYPERLYNMSMPYYRPETALQNPIFQQRTEPEGMYAPARLTAPSAYKRYTTEETSYNAYMNKSYESYPSDRYTPSSPKLDYGKRYMCAQNYSQEYRPSGVRTYPSPKRVPDKSRFGGYYEKGGCSSNDRVYERDSTRYFY